MDSYEISMLQTDKSIQSDEKFSRELFNPPELFYRMNLDGQFEFPIYPIFDDMFNYCQ